MRAAIGRPVRRALSSSRIVRNVNDAKKYGQSFGFKAVKEEERAVNWKPFFQLKMYFLYFFCKKMMSFYNF